MFKMKERSLALLQYLIAALLIAMLVLQSCSKSNAKPDPINPGDPVETETLKFIPDSIFRAYLKANVCPNAFDKTGKLIDITNNEVKNFTGEMLIDTITCPAPYVASLKGIEYFSKMSKLVVKLGSLDSLKLSKTMELDTLRLLNSKDLQYVDVSGCTNMRYVRIADIPVTSLDLSNLPALNYVNLISLRRLSDLNTANSNNLRHLMTVDLKSLVSVDVSHNPELRRLYLENAPILNSIDVTHNPKLYGIVANYSAGLKHLDVSKNDSLLFVLLDDSGIDSIDFSHNPKLVSVAMLRTPLRNLDFRSNPNLKLLYLDGCYALKTVDLRAQSSFDYYAIDFSKYYQMQQDDANQLFQTGFVSATPTPQHTIFAQATRKGVNGATQDLFGGLRLPIFQDAGAVSLTDVRVTDATKDNYSLVMSRRVLSGQTPALITVYATDMSTILCNDYDPKLFQCN